MFHSIYLPKNPPSVCLYLYNSWKLVNTTSIISRHALHPFSPSPSPSELWGEHFCPKATHSHIWSGMSITVQGEQPHRDALLWKAILLLLAQHHQPALPNEAPEDVHVPSHTTVREIEDTALPSHIVLQDDDTVFFQASAAPGKKSKEVSVRQVPYRWGQVDGETGWNGGRWGGRRVGRWERIRRPLVDSCMNCLIAWIALVARGFDKRTGIPLVK